MCKRNYMEEYNINDVRKIKNFKSSTFSGFKKTIVKKELIKSITNCKVETACYWTAEFVCSGNFIDLWEIIILYCSKNIHLGNPKLPIYIENRFDKFRSILLNGYIDNELDLRNNIKIREIFTEIISILCYSNKKHTLDSVFFDKSEAFNISQISDKLKAPKITYVENIYRNDDMKGLFIAINEFAYNISNESKNAVTACYWLEWIIEFDAMCKKKKEHSNCSTREQFPVQEKFKKCSMWLVWDTLLHYCSLKNDEIVTKIMNSLKNIYCIKFTLGCIKRRKFIIYFAILLLTENVNVNINLINNNNTGLIQNLIRKQNALYKQVKENEHSPNTDYLLHGIKEKKTNLEKTLDKINKYLK